LHAAKSLFLEQSSHLKYTEDQLRQLRSQLVGRITLPQDPGYAADREVFVNTFQNFPQIIVHCAGFADVVCSIRFAQETGLKPVCRAGGHNTAGYSVNDEMVIDVSAINYVRVDPKSKDAWVGAGANFSQVNAALDLYGLHIPGGGCETVCVAGYMQGGGYGFTSLMFGMNCDRVVRIQMALADGSIVTADSKQNRDLFWAVRGGTGNNFGVLLEIEYKLIELGELQGFGFRWPMSTPAEAELAAEALYVWQSRFAGPNAPKNLGQQSVLAYTESFGGKKGEKPLVPFYVVRGMFNGSEADCRKVLAPLFKLAQQGGHDYCDIWRRGSYLDLNQFLLNFPMEFPPNVPASARMLAKSHIVGRHLSKVECRSLIQLYKETPSNDNFIGFEPYGGAINSVGPKKTAFWHRRAQMDVFAFLFWIREDERRTTEAYLGKFDAVVEPLANGHSYQNYPYRGNKNFGSLYFGGNLDELVQIKRKYDPGDLFTFPQGLLKA
jgi:FAD/FMN-containing dehydrogenase